MNKQIIVALIVGLIMGSLVTYGIVSSSTKTNVPSSSSINNSNGSVENKNSTTNITQIQSSTDQMSMVHMTQNLKGKTGDEFDKAFIKAMIDHHQGAIDMANIATKAAKHEEIKHMADDIVSVQAKEIEKMQQWEKDWGYIQ